MGRSTDGDRHETVVEAHLGFGDSEHGVAELLVLDIAGSVVESFVLDRVVVDVVLFGLTDPVFAATADMDDVFRNQRFDLALGPHHTEYLLIVGGFGEHAQVEHAAAAVVEIDDHEGVVEDVGYPAVVDLVEVVDVLGTGSEDPLGVVWNV